MLDICFTVSCSLHRGVGIEFIKGYRGLGLLEGRYQTGIRIREGWTGVISLILSMESLQACAMSCVLQHDSFREDRLSHVYDKVCMHALRVPGRVSV